MAVILLFGDFFDEFRFSTFLPTLPQVLARVFSLVICSLLAGAQSTLRFAGILIVFEAFEASSEPFENLICRGFWDDKGIMLLQRHFRYFMRIMSFLRESN